MDNAKTSRDFLEIIYQHLDASRVAGLHFERLTDEEVEVMLDSIKYLTAAALARHHRGPE